MLLFEYCWATLKGTLYKVDVRSGWIRDSWERSGERSEEEKGTQKGFVGRDGNWIGSGILILNLEMEREQNVLERF